MNYKLEGSCGGYPLADDALTCDYCGRVIDPRSACEIQDPCNRYRGWTACPACAAAEIERAREEEEEETEETEETNESLTL